jgi:uncharacterized protein (TIGR03067 family)
MNLNVLFFLAASVLLTAVCGNEGTRQEGKVLEGRWSVKSVVRNRNDLPAERLKDLQAVFQDRRFMFQQGEKQLSKGTFRLDPSKTPRTIDLLTIDADGTEKTTLAIYELTEDALRICGAQPGEERPGEFAAMDSTGHTLTTFQRVK